MFEGLMELKQMMAAILVDRGVQRQHDKEVHAKHEAADDRAAEQTERQLALSARRIAAEERIATALERIATKLEA